MRTALLTHKNIETCLMAIWHTNIPFSKLWNNLSSHRQALIYSHIQTCQWQNRDRCLIESWGGWNSSWATHRNTIFYLKWNFVLTWRWSLICPWTKGFLLLTSSSIRLFRGGTSLISSAWIGLLFCCMFSYSSKFTTSQVCFRVALIDPKSVRWMYLFCT